MLGIVKKLTRRQVIEKKSRHSLTVQSTNNNLVLERNLNLPSLVFLNVSNSIGSVPNCQGIYVLTGLASSLYAGQYVSVSYLLAGVACLLSAFCFAEFASRVKSSSGSSYTFIYYSIGEFFAFLIGWMLFIGSLTSIAATSITWSMYLDATTNNAIKNFTTKTLHLSWNLKSPFNNYLDIPGVLITLIFFLISLRGIRLTTLFNNTLAILNICLLMVISIAGFSFGKLENLTKVNYENGFNGVVKGASVVMYAYMGFESSTYAIDETINPTVNVPLSMIISVFIISLSYCGSSLSLNLMQPFDQIDVHASYPSAFKNIKFMYVIVSIGPILSLMGSLISSIYSIARIAYTMSKDGLLFNFLSSVNQSTKIPDKATITSCVICILLLVVIDVKNLIGFTDITGFLTYSMIAFGLLIVRYYNDSDEGEGESAAMGDEANNITESSLNEFDANTVNEEENSNLLQNDSSRTCLNPSIRQLEDGRKRNFIENFKNFCRRNMFFKNRSNSIFIISFIYMSNIAYFGLFHNFVILRKILIFVIISSNVIFSLILSIFKQSKIPKTLTFKVPFVPFLPVLVIILNVYLMMASEAIEWIVFSILLVISLPIYFSYGIRHSKLSNMNQL